MFGACIKRTAPPSSAGSEPPQAAQTLEAANARIANVPRIDLLGGRGTRDFTLQTAFTGKIRIADGDCKSADVFVLDGTGHTVRPMPAVAVKDEQIEYRLPPLSATLFVCRPSGRPQVAP
jgi:hypothetical protein